MKEKIVSYTCQAEMDWVGVTLQILWNWRRLVQWYRGKNTLCVFVQPYPLSSTLGA